MKVRGSLSLYGLIPVHRQNWHAVMPGFRLLQEKIHRFGNYTMLEMAPYLLWLTGEGS